MTATSGCLKYHRDPLMGFRNAFILIYWVQLGRYMSLILASSPPFQRDICKSINWQNSSAEQQFIEVPHSIKKTKMPQYMTYQIAPDGIDKTSHRMVACLIPALLWGFFFWLCKWICAFPPNSQWKITAEVAIYKPLLKNNTKQMNKQTKRCFSSDNFVWSYSRLFIHLFAYLLT